jgi:hypothetical protein
MAFVYTQLKNYGVGFFTIEDRQNFFLRSYPGDATNGDVWVLSDNDKSHIWIADRGGQFLTQAQAQTIVTAAVTAAQAAWDALPAEQQALNPRPTAITVP